MFVIFYQNSTRDNPTAFCRIYCRDVFSRCGFKTLWTRLEKIVIVCHLFRYSPPSMMLRNLLTPLVLFVFTVFLAGCKNGNTQPANPFAQNLQTVPPPVTFSSQELHLGQTPEGFVPQPPASTFPQSGTVSPTQSVVSSTAIPFSGTAHQNTDNAATLFTAASGETTWTPVDVVATSQTAFQAMDTKVNSAASIGGFPMNAPASLIVEASLVTAIVDEPQSSTTLPEPQSLYSGKYTE